MSSFSSFEMALLSLVVAYAVANARWLLPGGSGPPRVPYYLPFLGHTRQLRTRAAEFLDECRAKYGNVFTLNYLGEDIVVFSGADASTMVKMQDVLFSESHNRMMFANDAMGSWEGAAGLPARPVEAAAVVKNNISQLLKVVLPDVLAQIERSIDGQLGSLDQPAAVDIHGFFSEIVVSTVAILLVGHTLAEDAALKRIMASYFGQVEGMMKLGLKWKMFPVVGNRIAQASVRASTPSPAVRQQIRDIIAPAFYARKGNASPATNLLDSLADDGHDLDAVANVVMVLIFAAISTTTNTCIHLISDLLAFPKFIAQLRREQEQVLGGATLVTKDHLEQMVHLNSAIRETLRHRAHRIGQWRITTRPYALPSGIVIPEGALLALDAASLHFDGEEYAAPFEYDPFRFVGSETKATRVTSSFIGFGSGRHACPGRFFAVQEVTAIMSTLLRKCDFQTLDGRPAPFLPNTGSFPATFQVVMSKPASLLD